MITKIENRAKIAAEAHAVAFRVWLDDEIINETPTGNFVCVVEFHCSVYTRPENKRRLVADIENRRIITISRGDAKRLGRANLGRPSGAEYIRTRSASESISVLSETKEQAADEALNLLDSGMGRKLAHIVADRAAEIEVEMRKALRDELDAIS